MEYSFFLSLFLLNFIFFKVSSYIFKILKIVDKPDKKLKMHKKTVVYNGGTVFFLNFVIIFFYLDPFPFQEKNFFLITIFAIIFLIGFLDDIFKISPTLRFASLIIILFIFIKNFDQFNLEIISFKSIDFIFYIYSAGILFTIFCFMSLIQACNMIDGINLQIGIYNLALIVYLNSFIINFTIFLIPVLIFFLYYNFKNQSFFGDGGSYLSSFLFGSVYVYYYNHTSNLIYSDDILVAMLIPGLDMIRLFCSRINSKQSPFEGDRNHLHHLILKKYGENRALLFSPIIMISPMMFKLFMQNNNIIILLSIIIYISVLIYLKSK